MSSNKTQHYDNGRHYERTEESRSDGSTRITVSEVHDTPLGRCGSNIIQETVIDRNGNSKTVNK